VQFSVADAVSVTGVQVLGEDGVETRDPTTIAAAATLIDVVLEPEAPLDASVTVTLAW
jgi:hypothetical protein